MFIPVRPVAKPRMVRSDKWKQRPIVMKYRSFKDELRGLINTTFEASQVAHYLVFVMEMPKSWSEKKRVKMDGKPHQQHIDVDNLIKGFFDGFLEEDSHIYKVQAMKIWGRIPGIYLGKADYDAISKTTEDEEARPHAIIKPIETLRPVIRGVRTQGGLRMRGLLPGTRRR